MEENERLSWIVHEGKRIYFEDYSGLTGDEMLRVLYDSERDFKALIEPVLVLLDFTDAQVTLGFFDEFKRLGKKYDAFVKRSASLGVVGFKRALAVFYHAFTGQSDRAGFFDDLEDAKDFLVRDEIDTSRLLYGE